MRAAHALYRWRLKSECDTKLVADYEYTRKQATPEHINKIPCSNYTQTSTRMRCIMGMIRSHSSMACGEKSAGTLNEFSERATHRFVELNLPVREVAQHLLHLGLFRVLEDGLLPKYLFAERV